jgi:hypothetical protein
VRLIVDDCREMCNERSGRALACFVEFQIITALSSGIYGCVVRWKSTDVSEEHVASLIGVEE